MRYASSLLAYCPIIRHQNGSPESHGTEKPCLVKAEKEQLIKNRKVMKPVLDDDPRRKKNWSLKKGEYIAIGMGAGGKCMQNKLIRQQKKNIFSAKIVDKPLATN